MTAIFGLCHFKLQAFSTMTRSSSVVYGSADNRPIRVLTTSLTIWSCAFLPALIDIVRIYRYHHAVYFHQISRGEHTGVWNKMRAMRQLKLYTATSSRRGENSAYVYNRIYDSRPISRTSKMNLNPDMDWPLLFFFPVLCHFILHRITGWLRCLVHDTGWIWSLNLINVV